MSLKASNSPLHLLPYGVDLGVVASIEGAHSPVRPPDPPQYAELERAGLTAAIGDQHRWFSDDERCLARWFGTLGTQVLSAERREGQRERTPDAVAEPILPITS